MGLARHVYFWGLRLQKRADTVIPDFSEALPPNLGEAGRRLGILEGVVGGNVSPQMTNLEAVATPIHPIILIIILNGWPN